MVLDEFPALKRMKSIESGAAQIAGHGVKMLMACQYLAQLKEIYSDNWESIVASAGVKLFFGNEDHFTQDYVSKLVGDSEVVRTAKGAQTSQGTSVNSNETSTSGSSHTHSESITIAPNPNSAFGTTRSFTRGLTTGSSNSHSSSIGHGRNNSTSEGLSQSVHKRPLLTPDEVRRVFGDDKNPLALVLLAGQQPLQVKRRPYFEFLRKYFDPHPHHPLPLSLVELVSLETAEAKSRQLEAIAVQRRKEENDSLRHSREAAEQDERDRKWIAQIFAEGNAMDERAARERERQRKDRISWWTEILGIFVAIASSIAALLCLDIFPALGTILGLFLIASMGRNGVRRWQH